MKDPAFLFYSNDFLSGTFLMTDEQIGRYIKLLCIQHQKGHLKEKDMLNICKTYDEDIFNKFIKDENGNYYNERLEEETIRRKKYSESRRNNRNKGKEQKEDKEEKTYEEDMNNICNSYDEHMETETITENINININEKENNKKKHPTLEEIQEYIKEKQLNVDGKQFYDYFTEGNWIDAKGNKVKNWKQKLLTWNKYTETKQEGKKKYQNYEQRQYGDLSKFYAN